MALNAPRPAIRLASQAFRSCRTSQPARPWISTTGFSTTTPRPQEEDPVSFASSSSSSDSSPRWAHTPERMKSPFSPHITKNPANSIWKVNEDPAKLDDALNNLLGKGGERLLPDELKWLAITHKSFDQGRRGFNDRLAFLGRQVAVVEALQSILTGPVAGGPSGFVGFEKDPFEGRREPFMDKALDTVDKLSALQPDGVFDLKKLQKLAVDTGISEVVRWKPRKPESLSASGIAPVMSGAIYAIVGAITMQHGGKVASRIVRERILRKIKA
ncbi:RNase III domain-containing protein [Xylariales sp. AK1849]|nr:RNase III domain-containing protein [Xylariales sp. AK1849]